MGGKDIVAMETCKVGDTVVRKGTVLRHKSGQLYIMGEREITVSKAERRSRKFSVCSAFPDDQVATTN